MKKVFINVPMKNRTNEQIVKDICYLWKVAELSWEEMLKPVHNFFVKPGDTIGFEKLASFPISKRELQDVIMKNEPIDIPESVKNPEIYFAGEGLKKLAECDYIVGYDDYYFHTYNHLVYIIARDLDIPMYLVEPKMYQDIPRGLEDPVSNEDICDGCQKATCKRM